MRHWPKNVVRWWWSWRGFFLAKTQYFVTLHENRFGLTSPKPPVRIYCFVWLLRGEKIVKILSQWWIVPWLAMLQLVFDFHSSVTFYFKDFTILNKGLKKNNSSWVWYFSHFFDHASPRDNTSEYDQVLITSNYIYVWSSWVLMCSGTSLSSSESLATFSYSEDPQLDEKEIGRGTSQEGFWDPGKMLVDWINRYLRRM